MRCFCSMSFVPWSDFGLSVPHKLETNFDSKVTLLTNNLEIPDSTKRYHMFESYVGISLLPVPRSHCYFQQTPQNVTWGIFLTFVKLVSTSVLMWQESSAGEQCQLMEERGTWWNKLNLCMFVGCYFQTPPISFVSIKLEMLPFMMCLLSLFCANLKIKDENANISWDFFFFFFNC